MEIIRKVCIHNKNPNDLKKQKVQTSLVQTSKEPPVRLETYNKDIAGDTHTEVLINSRQ